MCKGLFKATKYQGDASLSTIWHLLGIHVLRPAGNWTSMC